MNIQLTRIAAAMAAALICIPAAAKEYRRGLHFLSSTAGVS
jgi:hypothetical protein